MRSISSLSTSGSGALSGWLPTRRLVDEAVIRVLSSRLNMREVILEQIVISLHDSFMQGDCGPRRLWKEKSKGRVGKRDTTYELSLLEKGITISMCTPWEGSWDASSRP